MATGSEILSAHYKHMFEPIHLTKAILADRIDLLGQRLQKENNLPDFSPNNEQQIVIIQLLSVLNHIMIVAYRKMLRLSEE